jgi:hypothetical protein
MDTTTYKLKISCLNCFTVWEQTFKRGICVEELSGFTQIVLDELGNRITCPNCGCAHCWKVRP